MARLPLVFVLLFCAIGLCAQNVSTASLRWTCTETTDLRSYGTNNYACSFITRGTTSLEWLQRNGEVRTTYTITRTEGTWRNVLTSGTFTYVLSRDGRTGRLVIERSQQGTTITLDFSESGQFDIRRSFRVSEVAVEP